MHVPVIALLLALQTPSATVTGQVRDAVTGVPLAGARVALADADRETVTDREGRYRFEAPPGPQHLTVTVLGYTTRTLHALVPGSGRLTIDILLRPDPIPLDPLAVRSPAPVRGISGDARRRADRVVTRPEIAHHPLLPEPDVLLGLVGGMVTASPEAPEGLHVRGGAADQTAFVLDGVPVFSPVHVAGVFGAFNPDAIAALRVESATPSAALPGALAGVVVAETRAPSDRVRAQGAFTTSHARVTMDAPVSGGSVLASWRTGFANRLAPAGERSYPGFESGDLLLRAETPLFGGRASALLFEAENEVDIAAAAPDDEAPSTATNSFGWQSRSVGARWSGALGTTTLDLTAWRATMSAGSRWDPRAEAITLRSRRADVGFVASLAGPGWTLGARAERIATDYAAAALSDDAMTPALTLFADRRLAWRRFEVDLAMAFLRADGGNHWMPRGRVRWTPTERVTVDASYARTHQLAQSLRNAASITGAMFPADLFVGAGSPSVPVAAGDQGVVALQWSPAAGVHIGASAFARNTRGVLLADGPGPPFATDSIHAGTERARGIAVEAALGGARYAFLFDYGWQRVRRGPAGYTPSWAPAHSLGTGVRLYPTATSSVRLAVEGVAGRRGADASGPFEWESCNLLDRGCEFGGTPVAGEPGGTALPGYLRLDLGGSKHWHVRVADRQATIALTASFSNVFGRRNVLVFASDPATGERTAVLMRPRAPLVVGLDWRF